MDISAVHEPLAQTEWKVLKLGAGIGLWAVVEAGHLGDVGIELLYLTYKPTYVDALWLLKYIGDVVLFLFSRVDWKRGEKVKHHAIVKQLMRYSPWALQRVTLEGDVGVAFRLLADDLVPSVLALRRKQVRIECEHLLCGSGHSSLCNALGQLSLLKIT